MSRARVVPRNRIIVGDALDRLRELPDASVDMVLTSPPYFALRDYGHPGQIGLEGNVDAWVSAVRQVAAELPRVLTPTGSLWLNVGDTYSLHHRQGAARKGLLLGPERLVLALLADGWIVRNKVVWHKPNRMPTSARDRLAASWEALYVLVRQSDYFFDLDAIRVPHRSRPPRKRGPRRPPSRDSWRGPNADQPSGLACMRAEGRIGHALGSNPGDVWSIGTSRYAGGHHATFPLTLAERAIRAGCPERRCSACRLPYRRGISEANTLGELAVRGRLRPSCRCEATSEPGLVLDPFMGAGTTALGALAHRRDWLGIELNRRFATEAQARIQRAAPDRSPP